MVIAVVGVVVDLVGEATGLISCGSGGSCGVVDNGVESEVGGNNGWSAGDGEGKRSSCSGEGLVNGLWREMSNDQFDNGLGSMDNGGVTAGVFGSTTGVPGVLEASASVNGSLTRNSDPLSGPPVDVRWHHRSPPILRAIPFATSNPNPKPSRCLVMEASSRENALNKRGKNSPGIPSPVSVMENNTCGTVAFRTCTATETPPFPVNLTAL